MKSRLTAAIGIAALVSGCAQITAPDTDFTAPNPKVTLQASEANGAFSQFTANLTVTAFSLQHASGAAGTVASAPAGPADATAAFDFIAAPEFVHGDTLSVTWSGPAMTLLGSSYTVQRQAKYHFYGQVGK